MTPSERLERAGRVYLARQGNPRSIGGRFEFGRFYPNAAERAYCCNEVATTPEEPLALLRHCQSYAHVAVRAGVDEGALREEVKRMRGK